MNKSPKDKQRTGGKRPKYQKKHKESGKKGKAPNEYRLQKMERTA